jgi:hypothetical protein
MPVFKRPDAGIYSEVYGSGHPLLLFAAGGLRSQLAFGRHSPSNPDAAAPWMDPMVALADRGPTHLAESIRRLGDFLTRHAPQS